ncbi:MAG: PEP-CTERM sorting domain-containing protein [Phenylobacterium sp.]|uniref:PEPxxWA-CTERM sorting domain-containing protein n=1 Tax=Phenylobacterium sp. TaxID=1871053 RepID=UPI00121C613F|nr:PEPxxWA-CTERM sorting domain-containing protein [Phenylobacterium sp.]TAJ73887.1 MAG: PEP-CTERM sorting domain-containing protein [Phenylobacterium sp.]
MLRTFARRRSGNAAATTPSVEIGQAPRGVSGGYRRWLAALSVLLLTASASAAHAAYYTLMFEDIAPYPNNNDVQILDFYAGGASSIGTMGTNYHVRFGENARLLCLNSQTVDCSGTSRGGVTDFPESLQGGLTFKTVGTDYVNFDDGFTGNMSFNYAINLGGAPIVGYSIALYSGLDGTGDQLAFYDLTVPAVGCPEYNALFCPMKYSALAFEGVAKSIAFTSGGPYALAIDDITIVNGLESPVPEPAAWALMIAGFGLAGTRLRNGRNALPGRT